MLDVSAIVPAYNEEKNIEGTLEALAGFFDASGLDWEIVVADDGSTDRTVSLARDWVERRSESSPAPRVRVVSIPHRGKGAAVARGIMESTGARVLMTDADLSTPVTEWGRLAAALEEGADVAVGSRQAPGSLIERYQPPVRLGLGLLFGWMVRRFFPVGVVDSQCGFKGFRGDAARELFSDLKSRGYCFDIEILLKARALGYKVEEVPVIWHDDPDSRVKVWRDWPWVLAELFRIWRNVRAMPKRERAR